MSYSQSEKFPRNKVIFRSLPAPRQNRRSSPTLYYSLERVSKLKSLRLQIRSCNYMGIPFEIISDLNIAIRSCWFRWRKPTHVDNTLQMGQWLRGLLPRLCLLSATPATKCLLITSILGMGEKKKKAIYQKYFHPEAIDSDLCCCHMSDLFLYFRFWKNQKSRLWLGGFGFFFLLLLVLK